MSNRLTLYHGSPHCFDRFSLGKIGTGEGKQVYGKGLYFSEELRVAQAYRDELRQWTVQLFDGKPFDEENHAHVAAQAFFKWRKSFLERSTKMAHPLIEAREMALYDLRDKHQADKRELTEAQRTINRRAADVLEARGESKVRTRRITAEPGHVYTVRVDAAPDEFLLWERPVREQPPRVLELLRRAAQQEDVRMARSIPEVFANMQYDHETGSELYYALARRGPNRSLVDDERKTATYLDSIGIRGVRYLDQQSRSLGVGTYNYVVFNDAIIEVTHRDGIALAQPAREVALEEIRQEEGNPQGKEKHGTVPVSAYLPASEEPEIESPACILL